MWKNGEHLISIDCDLTMKEVARIVATTLGRTAERVSTMPHVQPAILYRIDLDDPDRIFVDETPSEKDLENPLDDYRYELDIEASEAAARAIYDALVEATDWALMLSFDEGADEEARRPAPASVRST